MKYNAPFGISDPEAGYINGDPSIGRKGSIPPAASIEAPQRELVALIEEAGHVPDPDDNTQVQLAVRHIVQKDVPNYANDTSVITDAVAAFLDPAPTGYTPGLVAKIKIAQACTAGGVTLNLNGLGTIPIKRGDGSNLAANDLVAGMVATFCFDGSVFQLVGTGGGGGVSMGTGFFSYYAVDSSVTPNTITASFTPTITALAAGLVLYVKVANSVTGATVIAVNGLANKDVRRSDNVVMQLGDIIAGQVIEIVYDGTNFRAIGIFTGTVLMAPRTYYVNGSTGSDSNNGLSSGTAFATVQKALDVSETFNLNGFTITINIADFGGYAGCVLPIINGAGTIRLNGNPGNPSAVHLTGNGANVSGVQSAHNAGHYVIDGLKLSSNNYNGLTAFPGSFIQTLSLAFGFCSSAHISAQGGIIGMEGAGSTIHLQGNATQHIHSEAGGQIGSHQPVLIIDAITLTYFATANGLSYMAPVYYSITSSLVAGCIKFDVGSNAVIDSGARGTSYLPGTAAGSQHDGGIYI